MNIQSMATRFMQSDFIEGLGWVLLNSLWQILAIAIVYLILRALFTGAQSRYVIGVTLMILIVASFVGTSFYVANQAKLAQRNPDNTEVPLTSADSFAELDNVSINQADLTYPGTGIAPIVPTASDKGPNAEVMAVEMGQQAAVLAPLQAASEKSAWSTTARTAMPYIVVSWCLGVLLFAVRPIGGLVFALRVRKRDAELVPDPLKSRFSKLAKQMGLKKSVKLIQTGLIQVPMVVGYFRPLVVLPLSVVTQFSTSEIDAILKHELAHIRRHDALVNWLQSIIETIFFFHPCVWWISNQVRLERENCCDDIAAREPGEAIHLANALYRLEESRALPAGLAATGGELHTRIKRLMARKTKSESNYVTMRLPAILAATVVVFAISLTAIASHPGSENRLPDDFGKVSSVTIQTVGASHNWKVMKIDDAKTIGQIESHFPGYRDSSRGADPAGYEIDMQVTFRSTKGSQIVVGLNSNLGLWNRSNGDFLMSHRLDFIKLIQGQSQTGRAEADQSRNPKSNSGVSPKESQDKPLVKLKGSNRPVEIEFDETTKTIIFRGPKKAVEEFGAILKKHNEATLQKQSKKFEPNRSELAQIELMKSKLARANTAVDHSRALLKKGFITESQVLAEEYQVRVLEAQLESLQADAKRNSRQANIKNENAKKQLEIEQQIQKSRISLAEAELQVAMENYRRLKQLTERAMAPKSSLTKAKLELERKTSELSILQLEFDKLALNSKSNSLSVKNANVPKKPKSAVVRKFELEILAAEMEYAKSSLQFAREKLDLVQLSSKQTGHASELSEARLEVKRLEADLRILELKYDRAKSSQDSAAQESASKGRASQTRYTRSSKEVQIELEYAKQALEIAMQQLDHVSQLFKVGRVDQQQIIEARQNKLLAEKNLRLLEVELDSVKKSDASKKKR